MIQRYVLIMCLALLWPVVGVAQVDQQTQEQTWEQVATRAEGLALRDDASQFAMQRLRAELVVWRDQF